MGQAANTEADTANKNNAVSAFFIIFPLVNKIKLLYGGELVLLLLPLVAHQSPTLAQFQ